MLELQILPVVVLADASLEVVANDRPEPYELGRARLVAVRDTHCPSGLSAYRIEGGPELDPDYSFLELGGSFEIGEGSAGMVIAVSTDNDLWFERSFEGYPNDAGANASARLLVEVFRAIAADTGAELAIESELVDPTLR
jgi:hypothetical protein